MFESIKFHACPEFRKARVVHEKHPAGVDKDQQVKQTPVNKNEYQQWLKAKGFM